MKTTRIQIQTLTLPEYPHRQRKNNNEENVEIGVGGQINLETTSRTALDENSSEVQHEDLDNEPPQVTDDCANRETEYANPEKVVSGEKDGGGKDEAHRDKLTAMKK